MDSSTRIKTALYAILVALLGGDQALTDAWRGFSAWAFANLQAADLSEAGGFKIIALGGLGLYLFWRTRTGGAPMTGAPMTGADIRAYTNSPEFAAVLRRAAERRPGGGYQPHESIPTASPPANPPNQGSGALKPSKETET